MALASEPLYRQDAESDVLSRQGVPVVKLHPLSQLELIHPCVRADRPGFREARSVETPGIRLQQRIMEKIHGVNGGDGKTARGRIQPVRGKTPVDGLFQNSLREAARTPGRSQTKDSAARITIPRTNPYLLHFSIRTLLRLIRSSSAARL